MTNTNLPIELWPCSKLVEAFYIPLRYLSWIQATSQFASLLAKNHWNLWTIDIL
jgi:hypothetical protein